MIRLSGMMKRALRAFADDLDEALSTDQLVLNGASRSSLDTCLARGLVSREEGEADDGRRRRWWWRLTDEGRETLEQIGA